jgi:hypothetical protein
MGGREDIWYATNMEIVEYMQVCRRRSFFADSSCVYHPSCQSAYLRVGQRIVQVPGGAQVQLF